jgi:hypothetical protein
MLRQRRDDSVAFDRGGDAGRSLGARLAPLGDTARNNRRTDFVDSESFEAFENLDVVAVTRWAHGAGGFPFGDFYCGASSPRVSRSAVVELQCDNVDERA